MQRNGVSFKERYNNEEYVKRASYKKNAIVGVKGEEDALWAPQKIVILKNDVTDMLRDEMITGQDIRKGKEILFQYDEIIGELGKESLSDLDRLYLAAYKPLVDELPRMNVGLGFAAYCFLANERWRGPVYIHTQDELLEYIQLQKDFQYLIRVCDRDDCIVLEIEEGKVVYPTKEIIEENSTETCEKEAEIG